MFNPSNFLGSLQKRRSLKDSANREKYKEKHSFSFISEVQPIEEALPQR